MPKNASAEDSYEPELASESAGEEDDYSLSSEGGSRTGVTFRPASRSRAADVQHAQQPHSLQLPTKRRRPQHEDPQKKSIRREKNREAARRCRKRKLDIVQDLENQLSAALDEYSELERQAAALQALYSCPKSSLLSLEAFIKAHGTHALANPDPPPLTSEALLELDQLLAEPEQPELLQLLGLTSHRLEPAPKPNHAAEGPAPSLKRGALGGGATADTGGVVAPRRSTTGRQQRTRGQPQQQGCSAVPPRVAARTAPEPAAGAGALPPLTLSFDFLPQPGGPTGSRPANASPSHHLAMPPMSPFAACVATPTHNLKLLADQAMHKLLHPSPYIHPTVPGPPPFPPFPPTGNTDAFPPLPLASSTDAFPSLPPTNVTCASPFALPSVHPSSSGQTLAHGHQGAHLRPGKADAGASSIFACDAVPHCSAPLALPSSSGASALPCAAPGGVLPGVAHTLWDLDAELRHEAPSDRAALEDLHNLWALGSKTPGLVSPVACPSPSPTPQQEEEMQQQQQQQQLASRPLSPLHSPGEVNEGSFLVP